MTKTAASFRIILLQAGLLCALCLPRPVHAGWNAADGQDSFGRDDVASVARSLGDAKKFKKAMQDFDRLGQQTRENERRFQELQSRREKDAQRSLQRREESQSGAALQELGVSAGGERVTGAMSAPGVDEGAPVDPDKKKLGKKEQDLWAQCRRTSDKITLSPEIKQWVAEFFWNVAKHSGGNEPLKEAVGVFNRVRTSEGKYGGYTIKVGPMPDENTYGLYTTGIREIVLRPNMPKELFLGVLEHELDHGVDDLRDQANKGGTKISLNWHRDNGDNIFKGQSGQGGEQGGKGGCKDCAGQQEPEQAAEGAEQPQGGPAAEPAEGVQSEESPDKTEKPVTAKAEKGGAEGQDKGSGDQMDGEYAETYAWRLMGCAGGGKNPCDVQKCK